MLPPSSAEYSHPPPFHSQQGPRSDKLTLTATGAGGLTELKEHLDDARASFGYVRVSYANDKESQREKFVLVVWIGSGVKVMRKAKISVHAADVKTVLRTFSIEVAAKDKDDLEEEPIVVRLRKVRSRPPPLPSPRGVCPSNVCCP